MVPVPGHCALALKGILFRQGAQNHFLAVCIYNSNRFVDRVTAATLNRRETWVKNMALMESCADKCPCPVPEYYQLRVPVPGYRARVFVRAPLKCYVHIGARAQAPNGTQSGRGLRVERTQAILKCVVMCEFFIFFFFFLFLLCTLYTKQCFWRDVFPSCFTIEKD